MGELRICLLGDPAVVRDGAPVAMPRSRKTRALLAFLVLNPGPQRRERLCEMFWQVPDDPRGALRWSLSKLRGLVNEPGIERIKADRERVAFDPVNCRVDLLDARARVAAGVEGLPATDLAEVALVLAPNLLEGLDLDELPDYHFFLSTQRQQVQTLRTSVLRALVDLDAGRPGDVIGWLQALVETDPYDVEGHCRLVEALAMAGRHKDAERQIAMSTAMLQDLDGIDLVPLQRAAHARPAVHSPSQAPVPPAPEEAVQQHIRFCRTAGGVQIAYASVGSGPPLVKTANWLNHLEFDWESPVWRHFFRGLCRGRRLIRYDARGNGLSDWDTDDYSLASMVGDLEAVVEAAGLERFPLLGLSQGCAVSVEYAARHPERVSRLILIGGYARGWNMVGSSGLARQAEAMVTLVRMGWGQDNPAFRQMFTSMLMPDAPEQNQSWFNELQRITTTPQNAAQLIRACGEVDVRQRLPQIKVPTLVLHAHQDVMAPLNRGRELAAGIPGARFVGLDSRNHLLPEGDPAWPKMMAEIDAFLAE